MTQGYVSLHNLTTFSIGRSLLTPLELCRASKEAGQTAVAVTDHLTASGMWASLKASEKAGIKLIAGAEVFLVDEGQEGSYRTLVLLAKDAGGYRNLLTLLKEGYDNYGIAFKKAVPRVTWDILKRRSEGLICLTGCGLGYVPALLDDFPAAVEAAKRLQGVFGEDDLGFELQGHFLTRDPSAYSPEVDQPFINRGIRQIADQLGARCVATTNAMYRDAGQGPALDVLSAIATGHPQGIRRRLTFGEDAFYVKTADQVRGAFDRHELFWGREFIDGLLANSVWFADRCEHAAWIDPKHSNPDGKELPIFPVKDEPDYKEFLAAPKESGVAEDAAYLRHRCRQALARLSPGKEKGYEERLAEELEVLEFHGFSSYMLMVADYIAEAKTRDVRVGPGRGCLAGDALVLTADGLLPISDVEVGAKVVTHTGEPSVVEKTFQYDAPELLIQVATRFGGKPIRFTPDHKIRAGKGPKPPATPDWIEACSLERGDYVYLPPVPVGETHVDPQVAFVAAALAISKPNDDPEFPYQIRYPKAWVPVRVRRITDSERKGDTKLHRATLEKQEYRAIFGQARVMQAILGLGVECRSVIAGETSTLFVGRHIEDHVSFSHGSLPAGWRSWDAESLGGLLNGLVCMGRVSPSEVSVPGPLGSDFAELCLRAGCVVRRGRNRAGRAYFSHPTWEPRPLEADDGGLWNEVTGVGDVTEKEEVFDLQVAGAHSYVTDSYAVHNSVGGCLVAYLLGIHEADPIEHGLIFARFHNKEKTSFPDIDTDFATSGREKVQDYIREKYGADHVAHVSNINRIKPKIYVRDIARTFEYGGDRSAAAKIGDRLAEKIPDDCETVNEALKSSPAFASLAAEYPEIERYAGTIAGVPRAWSTHAGGLIVAARPLVGLVPLRRDTNGQLSIEYDKDTAEDNGLVKVDTLGLSTLDIISDTHRIVRELGEEDPPSPAPDDDPEAYRLISRGDTLCVFQFASAAAQLCPKIRPRNLRDLSYINALVRPSSKHVQEDFLAVRDGHAEPSYLHAAMERALGETSGFPLFEESLMYLAQDVAGWDLHSADRLRKLTKQKGKNKKKAEEWKREFIQGAVQKLDIAESVAERIWVDVVEKFGGYGFNLCAAGRTRVLRAGANSHQGPDITLEALFQAQGSRTPWGKKIRAGKLSLLQMDPDGHVRPGLVRKIHRNGVRGLLRVSTAGRRQIFVTPGHRLLTAEGYVTARDLSVRDRLVAMGGRARPPRSGPPSRPGTSYGPHCGFPSGPTNPGWLDGRQAAFVQAREACMERSGRRCERCDKDALPPHGGECAHIRPLEACGGNYLVYHAPENVQWLCNGCHKTLDYEKGERVPRWTRGRETLLDSVREVVEWEEEETYDVEMQTSEHNFVADGIISHNSHATLYSQISYETAYLKAHYWLPFMVANLRFESNSNAISAADNIIAIKQEIRAGGAKTLPPDINKSDQAYQITAPRRVTSGLHGIKDVGIPAQKAITDGRPYSGLNDFLNKVESGVLRSPAVQALAAAGAMDSFGFPRKALFLYGKDYKTKFQLFKKRRPETPLDFSYPWPEGALTEEWTAPEKAAMEHKYLGESLTGTFAARYPGFFSKKPVTFDLYRFLFPYKKQFDDLKKNRKANSFSLSPDDVKDPMFDGLRGVLVQFYAFRVRRLDSPIYDQEMARGVIEDTQGNSLTLLFFPDAFLKAKKRIRQLLRQNIEPGQALLLDGNYQYDDANTAVVIVEDIVDARGAPLPPSDLAARKVSMRIAKRKKKIQELSAPALASHMEDEMVERGFGEEAP